MAHYEIQSLKLDGRMTHWRVGDGTLCRLASADDKTAAELFDYDPRCSLCWLGHAHSGDAHRKQLP